MFSVSIISAAQINNTPQDSLSPAIKIHKNKVKSLTKFVAKDIDNYLTISYTMLKD